MRIKEIQAVHVRIPLHSPYVYGRGAMRAFESVILRVLTDEGIVGYGESAPLLHSPTGDAAWVTSVIKESVARNLTGCDPFDIENIVGRLLEIGRGNLDIVAGIDLALWDIMGKYLSQPVYRLIGGICQDPIAVDYTISTEEPKGMAERAKEAHRKGFQGVVVKVTGESLDQDAQRVAAVRQVLPSPYTVRVDCNGVFSRREALRFLERIAALGIEFVEQPLAANDVEGTRECRKVGIPISLDESLVTLKDAFTFISHEACDIVNIKIPRVGGIFLAKKMAAIAAAASLPVIVGGRTALELSRCASRHFAASTMGTLGKKHEGPGPASQALSDDVVARRTTIDMAGQAGGHVNVERSPGLGVEVVWEKVERYAVT